MRSIILIASVLIGGLVFSQEKQTKLTPTERAEKKTEKMAEALELDEKQKASLLELNLEAAKEFESHKAEMKKLKEKMKATKDNHEKEVEAILTPEQLEKLNKMKAEKEQKRQARKANGTKRGQKMR